MRSLIVIAHNLRSTHNVGSLLRTAEGMGVDRVYMTGYTPYPSHVNDERLPHLARKINRQLSKTALGAEKSQKWQHHADITEIINWLKIEGYQVAALEQTDDSQPLHLFKPPEKIALVVGREVEGLESGVLELCDLTLEIPMFGEKESFNVVQAAAMALHHLRFAQ